MHPEFRGDEESESPDLERVLFCFAVEQEAKYLARRPSSGGVRRVTRATLEGETASDPDHRLLVTLHPDGRLEEMEILITGMGRDNAERKLHSALKRAPYQLVLSCGFAGGLNPYLTVGTVVFSTDEDAGLTPALLAAGACPVRFHSADRVATTVAEKQALWKETGADAVEMESQIIRAICRAHEIPSATIRVISDAAHEDLPLDFNVLMTAEQKLNYGKLALALLGSPGKIPAILRLQRQTQTAARNLANVLTKVIPGGSVGLNMKSRIAKSMAALLVVIALTTSLRAAEPTLKVGEPAPKLQIGKWAQGEPVKELQKGKAYIVEFWATWCGPCRVSIPHLNEIHNHFKNKGLIVIGQDCWEKDESLVAPFIKKMGDKMTYRVALDDKEGSEKGKMAETWMEAAGQHGIPTAFLVDLKGLIAWIGHPMELKDEMIEKVLSGKFDVAAAAVEYEKRHANEAQLRAVWTDLNQAMRKKDWDVATTKLDEAEKLLPEDERSHVGLLRFHVLIGRKNYKDAYQLAATLSDAQKDDAMLQNELAWDIATEEGIEERNLELAAKCAARADNAAKGKDANIVDTLARIAFMQGKKKEAIALEQRAVKLAEGDSKKSFQKTLDSYKNGELPKAE